jgi:hypothetical protein
MGSLVRLLLARHKEVYQTEFQLFKKSLEGNEMKHKPEDYINCGFYNGDEDIENHVEKVVKCRKPHQCSTCNTQIQVGDYALLESGFMDGEPVRCYTCIPCIDKWLDEINPIQNAEVVL